MDKTLTHHILIHLYGETPAETIRKILLLAHIAYISLC